MTHTHEPASAQKKERTDDADHSLDPQIRIRRRSCDERKVLNRRALQLLYQMTTREHFDRLTRRDRLPQMLRYLVANIDRLERYAVVQNVVAEQTRETAGGAKAEIRQEEKTNFLAAFLDSGLESDPQALVQPIGTKAVYSRLADRDSKGAQRRDGALIDYGSVGSVDLRIVNELRRAEIPSVGGETTDQFDLESGGQALNLGEAQLLQPILPMPHNITLNANSSNQTLHRDSAVVSVPVEMLPQVEEASREMHETHSLMMTKRELHAAPEAWAADGGTGSPLKESDLEHSTTNID